MIAALSKPMVKMLKDPQFARAMSYAIGSAIDAAEASRLPLTRIEFAYKGDCYILYPKAFKEMGRPHGR